MSVLPPSFFARATERDINPTELWLVVTAAVRDTVYIRASEKGTALISHALEEVTRSYPWIESKNDIGSTAMTAMTYGVGAGLWDMRFFLVDENGKYIRDLTPEESRAAVREESTLPMKDVCIDFPLKPRENDDD